MKFITPVSMKCTQKQYEKDLKEPLKELGHKEDYNWNKDLNPDSGCPYLHADEDDSGVAWHNHCNDSYYINHYNPELFLALVAMTEGVPAIRGEYLICVKNDTNFTIDKLYRSGGEYFIDNNYNSYSVEADDKGDENGHSFNFLRKATKEELINHFTKENKTKMKKSLEITLEKAQELYKNGSSEIKELLLQTFSKEELEKPKGIGWNDISNDIEYYYIDSLSDIINSSHFKNKIYQKNDLPSKRIAEAMLAYSQILLLIAQPEYNGECSSEFVNVTSTLYNIYFNRRIKKFNVLSHSCRTSGVPFKTLEKAELFMNNPENMKLLEIAKPLL